MDETRSAPAWAWCGRAAALLMALVVVAGAGRADATHYASIVIDYDTGAVIEASDADQPEYPASLTKMMTLYLAFDALAHHQLTLEQRLPVSEHAASMEPTKLGLRPGERVRVEDLILGMITKSANDAAVVLAEGLSGSEPGFARVMTNRARRLGMTQTVFQNANGLPDPDQVSTARDMAILGRALIRDFPQYYPYFSTRRFTFNGRVIGNHNHLLTSYEGADGIKTGYTHAAGFNLVASAHRNGRRVIGVVLGGHSTAWRDRHMAQLLDAAFAAEEPGESARPAQPVTAEATPAAAVPAPMLRLASMTMPAAPAPAAAATLPRPAAERAPRPDPAGRWIVQVGAFRQETAALAAGHTAQRAANLGVGQVTVERSAGAPRPVFRARIIGLTEAQARATCRELGRHGTACMALLS